MCIFNKVLYAFIVWWASPSWVISLQFSQELSDLYAVLGRPLWWTCSVLNTGQTTSLKFMWRFQDGNIVQDATRIVYGNGTLYFPQVLSNHIGKYTCIVSDSQSVIESTAFLRQAYLSTSVVLQPANQSVMLGTTVVLDCTVEGRPAPSFNWILNGQSIVRTPGRAITDIEIGHSVLQVSSASYLDSGLYTCTASHVTLTAPISSPPAMVRVYGAPVITSEPHDQLVPVGYNATFRCPANSEPKATLTWIFTSSHGDTAQTQLSSTPPSISIDIINGILQLLRVDESKAGVYSCTWYNQYGSAFSQATLSVSGQPQAPVFSTRPIDTTLTAGSELRLSCSGTGNPTISVTWVGPTGNVISGNLPGQSSDTNNQISNDSTRVIVNNSQGMLANASTSEQTSTLLIRNVSRLDLGVYTCRLVNSESVAESSVYVNVQYKPYFTTTPQSITVNDGSGISLSCTAVGNPQPIISWTLPGDSSLNLTSLNSGVNSNRNEVVLDNGDLRVVKASGTYRGTFICYASNNVGSIAASAIVTVIGVPSFSVIPVSQGVIEGDTVVLRCQVDSYPAAQVLWYYRYIMDPSIQSTDILQYVKESVAQNNVPTDNMTLLQPGVDKPFSLINGTSLRFEHTTEGEAGLYLCMAVNDQGSAFVAAILRVITFPVFQVAPTDRSVALGSTTRLDCFCVGIPVPSQRWMRNQRQIVMNSRTALASNGSLSIANVQEGDLGNYTCLATNQAGQRQRTARLTLSTLPYFLTPPFNTTSVFGSSVVIPCRGSSSTPLEVQWYTSDTAGDLLQLLGLTPVNQNPISPADQPSEGNRIQMSPEGDLLFKCTVRSDSGWYACVLRNSDGSTRSDPVYLTVNSAPSILFTQAPEVKIPGQTATVTCQATGSPTPVVSWLTPVKVEYRQTSVGDITMSVTETSQYVNSTLTITNLSVGRDAGEWTCKACNTAGCRLQRVTVNIEGNAVIRQIIGQELDNVFSITCVTAGVPVPSIRYLSGGIQITNSTEGHMVTTNELWIQKDKIKSDYTCQPDNAAGIPVTVSYPPNILIQTVESTSEAFTVSMTHLEQIPYLLPNKVIIRFAIDGTNVWQNQTFVLSNNIDDYLETEAGAVIENNPSVSCRNDTAVNIAKRNTQVDIQGDLNVSISSTGTQWVFSVQAKIHNLRANTAYGIQAAAVNIIGTGGYSPIVNARTLAAAPSPVTGVTVSVYNRTATVTWTNPDPLNGLPEDTSITVQVFDSPSMTSLVATITVNVLNAPTVTFPHLLQGEYRLRIFAYNSRTNTTSDVVTATFQVQDYPPSYKPNIDAVRILNAETVQINWTVPSNISNIFPPLTGYAIEVSMREQGDMNVYKLEKILNISGSTVSSSNIENLLQNRKYYIRVAGRNSVGIGPYSDPKNVTTPFEEFSETVVDSSTAWRIAAIVLIVVSSSLIILVVVLVVVYQMKIAKMRSMSLDSPRGSEVQLDNNFKEEMQHRGSIEGFENDSIGLY